MCDYGPWRKWILWISTLLCWATQFGFLGLKDGSQFKVATGLYILTCTIERLLLHCAIYAALERRSQVQLIPS